jgi:hypothetical protein
MMHGSVDALLTAAMLRVRVGMENGNKQSSLITAMQRNCWHCQIAKP